MTTQPALTQQDRALIADALRAYADSQRRESRRRDYIGFDWTAHRANLRDRARRCKIIADWLDSTKPRFLS